MKPRASLAVLAVIVVSIVATQSQLVIPFSDLGFNVEVVGGELVVRDALIKYSFKGEIYLKLTIFMNFTKDLAFSVFFFEINNTKLNVTNLGKKVVIKSKLSGEGNSLHIKMEISVKSGELVIYGNSTLEINSFNGFVETNEILFFAYIGLYIGAILVLVYRRFTMQKREEIIVE